MRLIRPMNERQFREWTSSYNRSAWLICVEAVTVAALLGCGMILISWAGVPAGQFDWPAQWPRVRFFAIAAVVLALVLWVRHRWLDARYRASR